MHDTQRTDDGRDGVHRRLHAPLRAVLLLLLAHAYTVDGASNYTVWRRYPIYQIMTDRFASTLPGVQDAPCIGLDNYCYGNWAGTQQYLGYIDTLNFKAIWTSPVTAQSPAGYHGYWPTDWFQLNPSFGYETDLQNLLTKTNSMGFKMIIDMVVNHVGYVDFNQSVGVTPFYTRDNFHDCLELKAQGLCDDCQVPNNVNLSVGVDTYLAQNTRCRLSGLPDLNHTNTQVRDTLINWVRYMFGTYAFDGARFDAVGHIPTYMYPLLNNATNNGFSLAEVLVAEVSQLALWYEPVKKLGPVAMANMGFLNAPMAYAIRSVFAWEMNNTYAGNHSCLLLKRILEEELAAGMYLPSMGMFVDNQDMTRFSTLNSSANALKNALTFTYFMPGLPIVFYGTEQQATGWQYNQSNRTPMWTYGFDTSSDFYTWIRMLNWYRYDLGMWEDEGSLLRLLYVNDNVFVWQRGAQSLFVVKSGLGYQSSIPINSSAILKGTNVCLVEQDGTGFCITDTTTSIPWTEGDWEPMIFVDPGKLYAFKYFAATREINTQHWVDALIATVLVLGVSVIFMMVLLHVLLPLIAASVRRKKHGKVSSASSVAPAKGASTTKGLAIGSEKSASTNGHISDGVLEHSLSDTNSVQRSRSSKIMNVLRDAYGSQSNGNDKSVHRQPNLPKGIPFVRSAGRLPSLSGLHTMHDDADCKEEDTIESAYTSRGLQLSGLQSTSKNLESRASSNHSTSTKSIRAGLSSFMQAKTMCPNMICHLALEYTVPFMKMNSELMFGGLGKVVDIFLRYSPDPVALIAPVYKPFLDDDGNVNLGAPVLRFAAEVYTERVNVDIYLVADPFGGAFFFLIDAEIFRNRTRGQIYTWQSEEEQLTFFSVFNQAAALVIQTFDMQRLQFHDYHGVLSLMYLPAGMKPEVLYVAHNADYNGSWLLTSDRRARYLYAMFNLHMSADTRRCCEHQGRFDMLRIVVSYMLREQAGLGVVAVSPLYAPRVHQKFSQFWTLPKARLRGILNGIDAAERPIPLPDDIQVLFDAKAEAKQAWQKANDLTVDPEARVFSFLGRMTHQKGCDLIIIAAEHIMKKYPNAQLAMAGPVGDEFGEKARLGTEMLASKFPGRVLNAAGQYVRGAEKEQLIMATDFFLCPSRFEPCGLADLEFAFAGGVCVGHRTGGLGKVPGYYFVEGLDNTMVLSAGLQRAMEQAMHASWEDVRVLAEEAARKEFPPEEQVTRYNAVWDEIHYAYRKSTAFRVARRRPMPNERNFFEVRLQMTVDAAINRHCVLNNPPQSMWRIDNLAAVRQSEFTNSRNNRITTNIVLILMQGVMQLPSFIVLLQSLEFLLHARVPGTLSYAWDKPFTIFFLYFVLYSISTIVFQAVAFICTARVYIIATATINVICSLLSIWGNFVSTTGLEAIFITTAVFSSMWAPLYGYIFLDSNVSVSEYGIWLMVLSSGFVAALNIIVMTLYYFAIISNYSRVYELFVSTIIVSVMSTCILVWLVHRRAMAAHYDWFKLRLYKQFRQLMGRKTMWCMVALSTTSAFMVSFTSSIVFVSQGNDAMALFQVILNSALLAFIIIMGITLGTRAGLRFGMKSWYAAVFFPGPVYFIITICALYSNTTALYLVTGLYSTGLIRVNVAGLLTLQTLPTREAFVAAQTMYISLGSLALALGGLAGSSISRDWSTSAAKAWFMSISGGFEVFYMCCGALLCWMHSKETLAIP